MPSVDDEGLLNVFLGYPHLGGALSSCSISISLLLQVVSTWAGSSLHSWLTVCYFHHASNLHCHIDRHLCEPHGHHQHKLTAQMAFYLVW